MPAKSVIKKAAVKAPAKKTVAKAPVKKAPEKVPVKKSPVKKLTAEKPTIKKTTKKEPVKMSKTERVESAEASVEGKDVESEEIGTLTVPEQYGAGLKRLSTARGRTIEQEVDLAIHDHLEKHGQL